MKEIILAIEPMTCNIEYCLGRSYRRGEYARTKVELVRSTVVTPGLDFLSGELFRNKWKKLQPTTVTTYQLSGKEQS